jgi:aminodeoxyfutalosine synthase
LGELGLADDWRQRRASSLESMLIEDEILYPIVSDLIKGKRLGIIQGLALLKHPNLNAVLHIADLDKKSRYGQNIFFNVNIHVNQSNICVLACKFCAFRRGKRADDAYEMDVSTYISQIEPLAEIVDEVHSVGGLHPDWNLSYYCNLFEQTKNRFPEITIKALTAVEIKHIATISGTSYEETIRQLKQSGLGSIPGGGAEILVDSVRDKICKGKESSQEYLDIHGIAHALGLPTNCTMLFGTVETPEERIIHLDKLRRQQDKSGGFQCFVPYPFLPDSSRLPEAQLSSANEILRMIAVSRLMLDNIPHIKAYRMNIGDELAELAISAGADDIDGTVMQESIMHLAGSTAKLDFGVDELCRLVRRAGGKPIRRDTVYSKFEPVEKKPTPPIHRLNMAK